MKTLITIGTLILILMSGSKTDGTTIPLDKTSEPKAGRSLYELVAEIEQNRPERRDEYPMHPGHRREHAGCKSETPEDLSYIMPQEDLVIHAPDGFTAGKGDFIRVSF